MPRILIVDDDGTIRATLERGLAARGYEVVAASDGNEALDAVREEGFDLVVTDINMPGMDGIELLISLVEHRPALRAIAISGGGLVPKEELLTDARLLGAVDVLEKPFDMDTLVEHIDRALDGS